MREPTPPVGEEMGEQLKREVQVNRWIVGLGGRCHCGKIMVWRGGGRSRWRVVGKGNDGMMQRLEMPHHLHLHLSSLDLTGTSSRALQIV